MVKHIHLDIPIRLDGYMILSSPVSTGVNDSSNPNLTCNSGYAYIIIQLGGSQTTLVNHIAVSSLEVDPHYLD